MQVIQGAEARLGTDSGAPLALYSNGNEYSRLQTTGQLTLGTTTDVAPDGFASKIQVNASNHEGSIQLGRHTANANGPAFIFLKTRSGSATPGTGVVSSGDSLGVIRWFASDGTDTASSAAQIQCIIDDTPGTNDMPGRLTFSTTPNSESSAQECMRLDCAGTLSVNGGHSSTAQMDSYASGYESMPKFFGNFIFKQRFPHIYVGRNERLNIPPWVLSDGPRGARVLDKGIKAVTTFPVAMARAATWNTNLEYRVHDVISKEMRANKTNYAATPCINLLRHPGWGRAQETYGEDPWLLGEFGVAAVKGIEKNNVMACPKHFALNSIENSRWVIDVSVDERTLREVYLPHFKKVIKEGKPASIMSAYNKVRGKYSGSNEELLTNILKNEWGFNGFISTDWMYGIYNGVEAINAGLNVEMPWQDEYLSLIHI